MFKSLALLLLTVELSAWGALLGPDRESMRGQVRALLEKKQWSEAIALLRPIQEELGTDPQMSVDLAKALISTGHRIEALRVIKVAASRSQGAAQKALLRRYRVLSRMFLRNETFQLYQDGLDFLLAGKYRLAVEKFETALRAEPGHLLVLVRLGQAFTLDQVTPKALSHLKEAHEIDSSDPDISLWLGRALTLSQEWTPALVRLYEARKSLPDEELAAIWLSEALALKGSRDQAVAVLEKDLEAHPSHFQVKARLAELLARSELPASLENLRRSRILVDSVLTELDRPQEEKLLQSLGELEVRTRFPDDFRTALLELKRQVEAQLSRVADKT